MTRGERGLAARRCRGVGLAGAAAVALAGAGAAAQEEGADAPPVVRRTAPAVVETIQPGALPEDPSSFTTVIETEPFEGEQKSVAEVLSDSVGVQVRRFGGSGDPAELSIRGSTPSQVVVRLDGVRLNTAQTGTVDLSTLPLSVLERVEVQRGGGSAQEGSDAIGGVVDLVTIAPGPERRTRAAVRGGSFSTWQGSLTHSGRWGPVDVVAGYDGFTTAGDWDFRRLRFRFASGPPQTFEPDPLERINNQVRRHAGLLKVGGEIGDRLRMTLSDQLTYLSRGTPGFDNEAGATGGQSETAHERLTRNLGVLSLEGADLPGGLDGVLRLYHRFERVNFRDPEPDLGPAVNSDNRNGSLGGRMILERRLRWLGVDHGLRGTIDLRRDTLDSNEFEDQRRRVAGLFLQDELGLFEQRLRLVPGLRWDHTEGFGGEWVPRLGWIVDPLGWLRLKGNVEKTYRVPNFDELFFPDKGFVRGNPGLEPEKAFEVDGGFELSLARLGPLRALRLEAAGFYRSIENSIVFVLVSNGVLAPQNTDDAKVRGAEVALSFGLTDWLRISGNYTFLDTELDATGGSLPGRARNEAAGRVVLGPASGAVKLVGEVQWTDEIPVDFDGSARVSARTTVDASLTVSLGWLAPDFGLSDLRLSVGGTNLTDRAVRDAEFFPQPGRTVYAGFEADF